MPNSSTARTPKRVELGSLAHELVDGTLGRSVQTRDRSDDSFTWTCEQRHHDVVERELRLPHQSTQCLGTAETP